eukprot:5937267-Pyramimonas_sp.AAC.1
MTTQEIEATWLTSLGEKEDGAEDETHDITDAARGGDDDAYGDNTDAADVDADDDVDDHDHD